MKDYIRNSGRKLVFLSVLPPHIPEWDVLVEWSKEHKRGKRNDKKLLKKKLKELNYGNKLFSGN